MLQPQRRRVDGTFETIDWVTAIAEIAERFTHIRDTFSGASIMYYGGGGQGNHLGGAYCTATRNAFGMQFRSNALAQEKTGEFWVNGRMMRTGAWLLTAMVSILVQEQLTNTSWLNDNTNGTAEIIKESNGHDVSRLCRIADVEEALVRDATRRIARANGASIIEDLGIQMNRNSTLCSYLEKLIWLGLLDNNVYAPLRNATAQGRAEFATAFFGLLAQRPELGGLSTVILYRTLGESLPNGAVAAAVLWGACHTCVRNNPDGVERAGFGEGLEASERLFDAVISSASGVVITDDNYDASATRLRTSDSRIHLVIPELLDELRELARVEIPGTDPEWPFVLSADERRSKSVAARLEMA